MGSVFYPPITSHRDLMNNYYNLQTPIYDFTRWMFLFGRAQIIRDLRLQPGEVVVDVGCGTGQNLRLIRDAVGEKGEVIGVDCSASMLRKARERVRNAGWKNVRVVDDEYGWNTVTRGEADAVLFSYSLSMIPSWQAALNCAREELKWNGRLGIVDFCHTLPGVASRGFAKWMAFNHVDVDRSYGPTLDRHFQSRMLITRRIMAVTWSYFRYIGCRRPPRSSQQLGVLHPTQHPSADRSI
jgi:S-adenosylmethionine-diacylgycerolhomoserine-N-methlytransferase